MIKPGIVSSLEKLSLADIYPLLNQKTLFYRHWQLVSHRQPLMERQYQSTQAQLRLETMLHRIETKNLIEPRAVYGFYHAWRLENKMIIESSYQTPSALEFLFPSQTFPPYLSISSFIQSDSREKPDIIAFQLVTLSYPAVESVRSYLQREEFVDYYLWHGLMAALTEALAEYCHWHIRGCYFNDSTSLNPTQIWQGKYSGKRYSFGYPACPELRDQQKIFLLLAPESSIQVTLNEAWQLTPEFSTSALILFNPAAHYFSLSSHPSHEDTTEPEHIETDLDRYGLSSGLFQALD